MKKALMLALMILFIYTLTFDIFMNKFFRIPTPLISCIPLVILFRDKNVRFLYMKEMIIFTLSLFLYYFVGMNNVNNFAINLFVFVTTALYFNYFVGGSSRRFNYSIALFIVLLLFSTVIMLLNQFYGSSINSIRSLLIGSPISQSPSGISSSIFTFGYQLAPLVTFLFVYVCTLKKNILLIISVALFSIISIYLGLQRSVLIAFLFSCFVFALFYYKYKSVLIIGIAIIAGFFLYNYAINIADIGSDNILAKNERAGGSESRTGLVSDNLKIFTDYPFGLIFYGKSWDEVIIGYPAFRGGLTSHNAYLMFITYLGPFLGIGLLIFLYYPIIKVFKKVILYSHIKENILLISLCFAFLAISLNALFHNAWLLNTNGPTVFLFFSIIHLNKQLSYEKTAL